jgi:hypothetical protein
MYIFRISCHHLRHSISITLPLLLLLLLLSLLLQPQDLPPHMPCQQLPTTPLMFLHGAPSAATVQEEPYCSPRMSAMRQYAVMLAHWSAGAAAAAASYDVACTMQLLVQSVSDMH